MLGVKHELAGAIIGTIFSLWLYFLNVNFSIILFCILLSIWAANIPDMIDPPIGYTHRGIGHNFISLILLIIISFLFLGLSLIFKNWIFIITLSFALSILSHLILDLITPRGLPMFGFKSLLGVVYIPASFTPFLNFIMWALTIYSAYKSINYLAKKFGGKLAMIIVCIPIWSVLLVLGIAFMTITWLHWLSVIMFILFFIILFILIKVGERIDIHLNKRINN